MRLSVCTFVFHMIFQKPMQLSPNSAILMFAVGFSLPMPLIASFSVYGVFRSQPAPTWVMVLTRLQASSAFNCPNPPERLLKVTNSYIH